MKAQLLKSLIAILIFNSAFLFSAKAQIVYTDVNPDTTVSSLGGNKTYFIDVNMDGTNDFELASYDNNSWGHVWGVSASPLNSNRIVTFSNYPAQLSFNAQIDSASNWNVSTSGVLKSTSGNGNWISSGTHYLGFKLIDNGNTFYGWIQLSINVITSSANFTLQSYAYNSTTGQPILAGQAFFIAYITGISGNNPICMDDTINLVAVGGHSYQWSTSATTAGINVNPQTNSTYTVTVTDTITGNNATINQQVSVVNINTNLTQIGNTLFPNAGATATYQWMDCSTMQIIPGAMNPSFHVTISGSYAAIIFKDGCIDTSGCVTVIVLGINELQTQDEISIYPNPATNAVTIKIPSDEAGEIQIINLFGCVVETDNYASLRDATLQIDVSNYPSGMYVVRWNNGNNFQAQKFSVTH